EVETLPAGRGPGRSGRRPRLEGLVALAGQYLDHDTAVVRVVLGEQHALCHPAELLSAEVPHAEQHGAAGEYQEPVGGRDGGALLVECEAPGDVEERAARRGGAHPERPSDREAPRTRDPYPARGDHDASEIQGAAEPDRAGDVRAGCRAEPEERRDAGRPIAADERLEGAPPATRARLEAEEGARRVGWSRRRAGAPRAPGRRGKRAVVGGAGPA